MSYDRLWAASISWRYCGLSGQVVLAFNHDHLCQTTNNLRYEPLFR